MLPTSWNGSVGLFHSTINLSSRSLTDCACVETGEITKAQSAAARSPFIVPSSHVPQCRRGRWVSPKSSRALGAMPAGGRRLPDLDVRQQLLQPLELLDVHLDAA